MPCAQLRIRPNSTLLSALLNLEDIHLVILAKFYAFLVV